MYVFFVTLVFQLAVKLAVNNRSTFQHFGKAHSALDNWPNEKDGNELLTFF
jgi:hypothetical protein